VWELHPSTLQIGQTLDCDNFPPPPFSSFPSGYCWRAGGQAGSRACERVMALKGLGFGCMNARIEDGTESGMHARK
jgi:hypothetical protein